MIEVSIALIIVGLIMVPTLQIYKNSLMRKKISDTKENVEIVQAALGKFVEKNGFYPAPAQPNIVINSNADAGRAVADVLATPPSACAANSVNVCSTPDTLMIDVDDDGTPETPDYAVIGAVPYATLGIPFQATLDGYGYQLRYAITARMTTAGTFNNRHGVIQVMNDGRLAARPFVYDGGLQLAHYVVLSHGDDARGAFNQSGTVTATCGTAANGLDFENCDNDRIFRSNVFQHEDIPDTTPGYDPDRAVQFNRVPGPQYFDDFVAATNTTNTGLWSYIPNQSTINTTQDGGIELGTDPTCVNANCLPRVRMNVNGNTLIEQQLKTHRICDVNDADCDITNASNRPYQVFTPLAIAGSPPILNEATGWNAGRQSNEGQGIRCIGGRGLRGISNYDEECQNSVRVNNPAIVGAGCNPTVDGLLPVGISATGQIICGTP